MPRSALLAASTTVTLFLVLATSVPAQSTVPFWSSYFGGSGRDEIVAIRRGPGTLITIVGHTTSTNLPVTASAPQPTYAGNSDCFIARFDPIAQQLLFCTYLGGSDLELVFDAEVDPLGGTTVAGVSLSIDFPAPVAQPSPTRNGPSDGFVAQIDAYGLLGASMFVGGPADDRVCDVEIMIDATTYAVMIAGVTETQLPTQWTAGTVFPSYRGGLTDAFVARVDPENRLVAWATHLGGNSNDGMPFANWSWGMGPGNLDRMALTIDASRRPVLTTVTAAASIPAPTTPGAMQASPGGISDAYMAILDLSGTPPIATALNYATFHGGSAEERPKAIALHPHRGFVIGGYTLSTDMTVTPNCLQSTLSSHGPATVGLACDGFVCHIDPTIAGSGGRLYSTYLGGSIGEDTLTAFAVESSGLVTLVGHSAGAMPTTPRCLQDTFVQGQLYGYVARMALAGQGAADLLYATYVGGAAPSSSPQPVTLLHSLVLDEVGDVYVAGSTLSPAYPTIPVPTPPLGGRDGCYTHLPLLPGGVFRNDSAFANPACSAPLYTGAGSAPVPGATFVITATNAPPNMPGLLVLGDPIPPLPLLPLLPPLNGTLLVNPLVLPPVGASATGAAQFGIVVNSLLPPVPNWGLAAQWFFFTSPACPGSGMQSNSERLNF